MGFLPRSSLIGTLLSYLIYWKEINRLHGTQLEKSSAHHPQTDSQTEALDKRLEMYLPCFPVDTPATWSKLLPWAEFWYNTSFQNNSKLTPLEVVYGRPPPAIIRFVADSSSNPAVVEFFRQCDETLAILRDNLVVAQDRMKLLGDKGRHDISFAIGDYVYIRLRPYRQRSIRLQHYSKLSRRYFGPFQIIQRIGEGSCKLDLSASSRIHNVFHVCSTQMHWSAFTISHPN